MTQLGLNNWRLLPLLLCLKLSKVETVVLASKDTEVDNCSKLSVSQLSIQFILSVVITNRVARAEYKNKCSFGNLFV